MVLPPASGRESDAVATTSGRSMEAVASSLRSRGVYSGDFVSPPTDGCRNPRGGRINLRVGSPMIGWWRVQTRAVDPKRIWNAPEPPAPSHPVTCLARPPARLGAEGFGHAAAHGDRVPEQRFRGCRDLSAAEQHLVEVRCGVLLAEPVGYTEQCAAVRGRWQVGGVEEVHGVPPVRCGAGGPDALQ